MSLPSQLRKISNTVWELPVSYKEGMLVPARIIASESLLAGMEAGVFEQAQRVADRRRFTPRDININRGKACQ